MERTISFFEQKRVILRLFGAILKSNTAIWRSIRLDHVHFRCFTTVLLTIRGLLASVVISGSLIACTPLQFIDVPSINRNGRVEYVILHFTTVDFDESLEILTKSSEYPVSSHYLVPEQGDPSYPRGRLAVYRLVEEDERAWHAGKGFWRGVTDMNSRSIGIEIVNRSGCANVDSFSALSEPETHCRFLRFDTEQIELVIHLVSDILRRHPNIQPDGILAHSDIAFDRKLDPGPTFPWHRLYQSGVGAWYDEDRVQRFIEIFEAQPLRHQVLQRALSAYGYDIEETDEMDQRSRFAIRAFQMHFRPSDWSGLPDVETFAIVFALLEKYRPEAYKNLMESLGLNAVVD